MDYGAVAKDSINAAVCTLGTLCFCLVNIEENNLRKTPVLQLKQSNWPLMLYMLNEQIIRHIK